MLRSRVGIYGITAAALWLSGDRDSVAQSPSVPILYELSAGDALMNVMRGDGFAEEFLRQLGGTQ